GEPLKLRKLVSSAVETEDEQAELEFDGVADMLEKRWLQAGLLEFEWETGGPMSWFRDLTSLDLGLSRGFICTYDEVAAEFGGEDEPLLVLAPLEPAESSVFSAFFRDFVRDNGQSYRFDGFFGSLPSNTRNYQPDLISADVIKESYWRWMEWASRNKLGFGSWTNLRDRVLRKAMD